MSADLNLADPELASLFNGENGAWVESLFEDYVLGNGGVSPEWGRLFDRLLGRNGTPPAAAAPRARAAASRAPEPATAGLVAAYRTSGHMVADLDPLGKNAESHPFLDPAEHGVPPEQAADGPVAELIERLRATYCGTLAVEFMEMRSKERRDWLIERIEPCCNRPDFNPTERRRILGEIVSAERFEQFLQKRFLGQKRFSLEGGEGLIPMLDVLVEDAAELGTEEIVLAMAHRGRLNVMAHTMGMPYRALFSTFQQGLVPTDAQGAGDVKYHRGYSTDRTTANGKTIHLSLCPNPSHLEAINPVAEGMVRAKQNYRGDTGRSEVIALQIHGDAAFTGQGLVMETLGLSELENYWTGGTIHIIVNNQIGFTAEPDEFRFTRYPSDIAKVIQAPVFHVNADDPEACARAARLAIQFRQQFREDVIINLMCYRRHGHNEGDDPSFTQPVMYQTIKSHPTVATLYTERLIGDRVLDASEVEKIEAQHRERCEAAFEESAEYLRLEGAEGYHGLWRAFGNGGADGRPTAVSRELIDHVASSFAARPEGFHAHPKVDRQLAARAARIAEGQPVDWGTAEALAFGSLLAEGSTVRLTGQDSERGTFSHRHAVLHDVESGDRYVWLDSIAKGDARLIICNSMLSEAAVLGFEYGYSTVDPTRLTVWEAQYGDFANGAQVIIDQFIASAETKWNRSSGLVMLLPHGFEGHGPEHSSARLERFLQLSAEDNWIVTNLTTPAQLFHALRRQLCRTFRKPLVVMSPKSLLRHPKAVSPIEAFTSDSEGFHAVIDDPRKAAGALKSEVRRVLVCSGKVFYTLLEAAEEADFDDVAIVRVEQLHPFPFDEMREVLSAYDAREVAWVQEEPFNMGGWAFVRDRLGQCLPRSTRLRYVGRPEAASPATGSFKIHAEQENEFVREAFAKRARKRRDR